MASKSPTGQASALHEILKWSLSRPDWQRDALRRVIVQGVIDEADLKELDRLCRAKHGADASKEPSIVAEPLAAKHLPPEAGSHESVSLKSIGNLQQVDRLPSDQVIPLGSASGLTVIFGDNGCGKSGYARVIKKACRARGAPPDIRSNVFAPPNTAKASAEIVFRVAGVENSFIWSDGVPADPRLANVYVFDASSADHYLGEDSPAAFTPYGLDVLPMLSKACDAVRESLQQDINKIRASIAGVAANWKYDSATAVGALVGNLAATTKPAEVDALAGLETQQKNRLLELREALKADSLQKAKETRAAAARLNAFATKVAAAAGALADDRVEALRTLVDQAKTSEATAKAFAAGTFDSTYLNGTGTASWRMMWDAARIFSNSIAYKDQIFPHIGDGARCVLCQQDLDAETVDRLAELESFCKDKSQQLAAEVAKRLKDAGLILDQLGDLSPGLEKLDADFGTMTAEQRVQVSAFAKVADARLSVLRSNLATRVWKNPDAIRTSPEASIKDLALALEARANTEQSAHDPVIRLQLEAERRELDNREWLGGVKLDVMAQIDRYKLVKRLQECQKDTVTNAITTRSSELTKQFVTDAFRKRFVVETKTLGLRTLDVQLDPIQGKKGETKFGLRLTSAAHRKVIDIASEGERRCIALAAFLSELSQASHQSALVFDDPVSSLDHWHRERIAARLVDEATARQVIVFTHDIVFLNDLLALSEKARTIPHVLSLEWRQGVPGRYLQGLPWDCKSPAERLHDLEKEQQAIATGWNPLPNDINVQSMRHAYSRLRATLERIVEKELLAGIVSRFESQIITGKLTQVIGIPATECEEARRLIQRCHDITDAHDPAPSKHASVPDPTDLAKDIAATDQLLQDIRARKKASPPTH